MSFPISKLLSRTKNVTRTLSPLPQNRTDVWTEEMRLVRLPTFDYNTDD